MANINKIQFKNKATGTFPYFVFVVQHSLEEVFLDILTLLQYNFPTEKHGDGSIM